MYQGMYYCMFSKMLTSTFFTIIGSSDIPGLPNLSKSHYLPLYNETLYSTSSHLRIMHNPLAGRAVGNEVDSCYPCEVD